MKLQIQEIYKPKQVQYKGNTWAHFSEISENERQRNLFKAAREKVKMPAKKSTTVRSTVDILPETMEAQRQQKDHIKVPQVLSA